MKQINSSGQTMLEVVVVIATTIVVVAALTIATISGFRNAQFAKNQTQATKLAQEGMDRIRVDRDTNASITNLPTLTATNWRDINFWNYRITTNCNSPNPCYLRLQSPSGLDFTAGGSATALPPVIESLNNDQFSRVVILADEASSYQTEKRVTVVVTWTDFSGRHESRLSTILRRI